MLTDKDNLSDEIWEKAINIHVCGVRTVQDVIAKQKQYGLNHETEIERKH